MPCASFRRRAIVGAGVALVTLLLDPGSGLDRRPARADQPTPIPTPRVASVMPPTSASSASSPVQPFPRRGAAGRQADGHPGGSGGWWFGTAGIAMALALCGGISLAMRRGWAPAHPVGLLRVVGRTSLSPRHTVHLLSVGDRVLIVGTGPQGAPSLLGELTDLDDQRQLTRRRDRDQDEPAPVADPPILDRAAATFRRPSGDES